jgi:hypothetical protein
LDDSIQRLTALLGNEAEQTREGRQEPIRLAAFLFAACRWLTRNRPTVEMRSAGRPPRRRDRGGDDLAVACRILAELKPGVEPPELFVALLAALARIDAHFKPWMDARSIPVSTFLGGAGAMLSGEVFHWVNGPSLLREVRAWAYETQPGPQQYRDPVQDSLANLGFYLMPDDSFPGAPAAVRNALYELGARRPALAASRALIEGAQAFRIVFCPLPADWHTRFDLLRDGAATGFTALREDPIDRPETLARHVDLMMSEAEAVEARLLIFPELTLDPALRQRIVRRLEGGSSLLAVCAGSFHIWSPGAVRPRNEALVLDGGAFPLWTHCKNGAFDLRPGFARANPQLFPRIAAGALPAEGLPELIELGTELQFLDCPLGRIVVLICADALDRNPDTHPSFLGAILALRPDLVLLLAMSPKTASFHPFLEDMVRQGIGVLFVNAACACSPGAPSGAPTANSAPSGAPTANGEEADDLAFFDLCLAELPGSPPTRLRWKLGGDPEWLRHRKGPWRPIAPSGDDTGVHLLPSRGGLVVNLEAALTPLLRKMRGEDDE